MQTPFNNLLNSKQKANIIKTGLFYGNPTMEQAFAMFNPNETCINIMKSGVLNKYYNMPYQSITDFSGLSSKKEITEMISLQKTVTEETLKFIKECEDDVAGAWFNFIKSLDLPEIKKEKIQEFIDSTDGILYLLKYYYQRPRPFQLAFFYNMPLYPLIKTDASSPAYPSGHSIDAFKMAFLLGKRHPEKAVQLLEFAESISKGRVLGGVHYPTDSIISKMMARELVDMDFFKDYL
jgi:hypothetical protein